MSYKYYHKNKACCILMGIKNFAKKLYFTAFYDYVRMNQINKEIVNSHGN